MHEKQPYTLCMVFQKVSELVKTPTQADPSATITAPNEDIVRLNIFKCSSQQTFENLKQLKF